MTLDEIATAINGISSKEGIMIVGSPAPKNSVSLVTIQHSFYSPYIDTNFPFYLVFGCYISGISGMVGKIIQVDRNKSTIKEVDTLGSFGSSGTLHYTMNDTIIAIATNSNTSMTFSQTSNRGFINIIGVKK